MEATHTPGPWRLCGGGTPHYSAIHSESDGYIVFGFADYQTDQEGGKQIQCPGYERQRANARLISAAPDLLEALERLMECHCPLTGSPSHERLVAFWEYEKGEGRGDADDKLFALAAIAKAKGTCKPA